MITLTEAISLATKAHEGQWRKPRPATTEENQYKMSEIVKYVDDLGFLQKNGNIHTEDDKRNVLILEPYITHPLAVMEMMTTEEEKIIAVLHDVIEDTKATLHYTKSCYIEFEGKEYQITKRQWVALYALTKKNQDLNYFKEKGEYQSYSSYIKDISLCTLATKVKIADMFHNMSCNPSDKAKEKYLKALSVLLKSM